MDNITSPQVSSSCITATPRTLANVETASATAPIDEQLAAASPSWADLRPLPMNDLLTVIVTIRKGSIEKRSRGGTQRSVKFIVSEGYQVLRSKVVRLFSHLNFSSLKRNDDQIFFRQRKGASQHQFAIITAANFVELLRQRWKCISPGDRMQWGDSIATHFAFEMFIFCCPIAPQANGIQRATAARIRQATERVREYQQETEVALGLITMSHVTTMLARQTNMDNFTLPSDNTTRQAIALDEARAVMDEAPQSQRQIQTAEIKLRANGSWFAYEVDTLSLHNALGLPAHDIFTQGIFHGHQPVPPSEVDVEDTEHMNDEAEQVS